MSKRLLLHIGYPKTATTTLQEEVFLKLHYSQKINYLGRTITSSHTRTGKSKFIGTDWVWDFRRHLFYERKLPDLNSLLVDDKLNVISDENLSCHDFFDSIQYGKKVNHDVYPNILKELISENVEVKLLVTIRNQADLIFSTFVQKFRFLYMYDAKCTFNDFVNNKIEAPIRDDINHLELFDFNLFVENWENTFQSKSKATVLFFEDLKFDRNSFYNSLSEILPVSSVEIREVAGNKHHRKRGKSQDGFEISVLVLTNFGVLISKFFDAQKLERTLLKRYFMKTFFLLRFEKKLFFNSKVIQVPNITIKEKEKIKNIFSESNRLFAEQRGISLDKMIINGYIKK